jgi:nucleotide-binding universal stress UspA family protein
MFEKVLTATGMLDACDPALIAALDITKQNQGKLFVMHVLEPSYVHECGPEASVTDFKTGEVIAPRHEYKEEVKEELDKKCAGALKAYGNYEINVVDGRPGTEIRRWARKFNANLIVLGPHVERPEEEKKLTGEARGNTVEDVIAHVTTPVMIVNSFVKKESLDFKKILVCIDFSKSCDYACRFAVKLAQRYGSKLFLFHMSPAQGAAKDIEKDSERLKEFCKVTDGVEHEYLVWQGTMPHLEILKGAREKQADLIVMGSHTRETGEKSYIGSAVDNVSKESSCPVAVVTHPDAVSKIES